MKTQSNPRSAIVTGAASGIGKASAKRLALEGYRVLLADRDATALSELFAVMRSDGFDVAQCRVDVAEQASCDQMAALALSEWGNVDVLVANAGVQLAGTLLNTSTADWQTLLAVNLNGVAMSCKAVLPAMTQSGSGSIVIISSINALRSNPGMAIYDASKAAVLGLMRSLAAEHGHEGVRVNAICPGDTLTDFHINRAAEQGISVGELRDMTSGYGILGRAAEPVEIANAVNFLAGDQASFITGHTLCVDGGFSVRGHRD